MWQDTLGQVCTTPRARLENQTAAARRRATYLSLYDTIALSLSRPPASLGSPRTHHARQHVTARKSIGNATGFLLLFD